MEREIQLRADRIADMFEDIKSMHALATDAALARLLGVQPPVISKIRAESIPVGATMIISIHEKTGWPIARIKRIVAEDSTSPAVAVPNEN